MIDSDEGLADAVSHALSDRTRRDILRRVLAGEHSITTLAASYDMSFAAVQKHVAGGCALRGRVRGLPCLPVLVRRDEQGHCDVLPYHPVTTTSRNSLTNLSGQYI